MPCNLTDNELCPVTTDPKVSLSWAYRRIDEGYTRILASWRSQNSKSLTNLLDFAPQPVYSKDLANSGES